MLKINIIRKNSLFWGYLLLLQVLILSSCGGGGGGGGGSSDGGNNDVKPNSLPVAVTEKRTFLTLFKEVSGIFNGRSIGMVKLLLHYGTVKISAVTPMASRYWS